MNIAVFDGYCCKAMAIASIVASLCYTSRIHAEEKQSATSSPSRSASTLSTASQAASAAALAANAAAEAAASAAKAANAAIEAIQTLLPPTQRLPARDTLNPNSKNINISNQDTSLRDDARIDFGAEPFQSSGKKESGERNVRLAEAPLEHNLFGLTGLIEIPVSTDANGDFSGGLAKVEDAIDPISNVSAMDLNDALAMALGFSRDVLIAEYRQEQAAAQAGQAKAALLPSLQVYMRTGKETSSPGVQIDPNTGISINRDQHTRSDRTFTLKQPLFDMAGFYDWRRRKVIEEARAQNKRGSRGDTYLATINAYLNLSSTRLLTNMASEYEEQIQELYSYIDKRAKAGAANNSDKERVKARVLSIHSAKVEQEGAHAAAGVEFARVVNAAPTSLKLPNIEEVSLATIPSSLDEAMELALKHNPDITSLQAELTASELDKTSTMGRFLPKLDLEVSSNSSMHPSGADYTQRDERVMVVMNWMAFNGGGDLKLREEKVARRSELLYRLDDQRRKVLQNLSAQYATLKAVRTRLDQGYLELESISSAAKSMSKRMLSGNQSLLDLLDVYDRNYQARTRLVNLHMQEMTSVAQIARLVQGDPSDTTQLSSMQIND